MKKIIGLLVVMWMAFLCFADEAIFSPYQRFNSLTFLITNTLASNLIAGANVTITFGSNGVATIASSSSSGGSSTSLILSNANGSASTSLTTGQTLNSNIYSYVFSSGSGNNLTLSIATNSSYPNGQLWQVSLGTEGTNYLSITPTNFSAGTSDKINRSTNWIITSGMSVTIQKQGTNFVILNGLPSDPVGTIKAWHKNMAGVCTNLSSSWVECNGQTLSDVGSYLNGKTIPNLNGNNNFLRGNTTSTGASGGAATHTHNGTTGAADGDNQVQVQFGMDAQVSTIPHFHTFTTDAGSSLPPYMDVVWIMRVK